MSESEDRLNEGTHFSTNLYLSPIVFFKGTIYFRLLKLNPVTA